MRDIDDVAIGSIILHNLTVWFCLVLFEFSLGGFERRPGKGRRREIERKLPVAGITVRESAQT